MPTTNSTLVGTVFWLLEILLQGRGARSGDASWEGWGPAGNQQAHARRHGGRGFPAKTTSL